MTYVNHGRWVVDCATNYCSGARLADDDAPCSNCGRITVTEYPVERLSIETALRRRIVPETRNWKPGETVQHLETENYAHISEGVIV